MKLLFFSLVLLVSTSFLGYGSFMGSFTRAVSDDPVVAKFQLYCQDLVVIRDGKAFPKHETEGKYYGADGKWYDFELGATDEEFLRAIGYGTATLESATEAFLDSYGADSLEQVAVSDGFATTPDVAAWLADQGYASVEELARDWYGDEDTTDEENIQALLDDYEVETVEAASILDGFGSDPDMTAWAQENGYDTPEEVVLAAAGVPERTAMSANALEVADRASSLDPVLLPDVINDVYLAYGSNEDAILFGNRIISNLREYMYDADVQSQQDAFYGVLVNASGRVGVEQYDWTGLDLTGRDLGGLNLGSTNLTADQINDASSIAGAYFHYKDMAGVSFEDRDISSLHLYGASGVTAENVASASSQQFLDLRGTGITSEQLAAAFVAQGKLGSLATSQNIIYGDIDLNP